MALYYRTAEERCIEAENEQEREYPTCDVCGGRIGIHCEGHEDEEGADGIR